MESDGCRGKALPGSRWLADSLAQSGRFPGNPGREVQDRRESGRGWGRKAQRLARAWGLGRKLGSTHWWRGAAVQMENDTNNNVGRIPDKGLKEHLAK